MDRGFLRRLCGRRRGDRSARVVRLVQCFLAVRTINESNNRDSWRKRARRVKAQRLAARQRVAACIVGVHLPLVVTLTRVGARKLDSDGVPSALKAIRDGVADALGVDDGRDDLVQWRYAQQFGPRQVHGVQIEITQGEPCTTETTTTKGNASR